MIKKRTLQFVGSALISLLVELLLVAIPAEKTLLNYNALRCFFLFILFLCSSMYFEKIKLWGQNFIEALASINRRTILEMISVNFGYLLFSIILYLIKSGRFFYGYWAVLICGALVVNTLYLYVKKAIHSVETLFFLCGFGIVSAAILSSPLFANHGDAAKHFSRCIEVSNVYVRTVFPNHYSTAPYTGQQLYDAIIMAKQTTDFGAAGTSSLSLSNLSSRYIAYLPHCFGLVFSDAFLLSPVCAYYAGLLSNSVFILAVVSVAMKKLKSGKLILASFFLMPYSIRLLRMYSYTMWVWAFLFYAVATVISEVQNNKTHIEHKTRYLYLYTSFILAFLVKPPYFLLTAFALLIPPDRFSNKKQRLRFYLSIILVTLTGLLLIFLPALISPDGFEIYSDMRDGSAVSATGQFKYIFTHPVQYSLLLFETLFDLLSPEVMLFGNEGLCNLIFGKLCLLGPIFPALLLFAMIIDRGDNDKRLLTGRNLFFTLILVLLNCCVIATTMYMNYSEVGSDTISGLNPLYCAAVLYPAVHMLGSTKVTSTFAKRGINTAIIGSQSFLLLLNVYAQLTAAMF